VRFQAAHPRLRFSLRELSSSDQVVDLLHDRLDAGFVHISQVPSGLAQILVSSQPFMACVPAGHALAQRPRVAVSALAGEPFALIAQAVSPDYHARIANLCMASGFSAQGAHELRHWLSVVSLVAQGLAVALVPAAMQQAGMAGVSFLPLEGADAALPRYDTHCLWRPRRDQPALAAFLSQVSGVAQTT
jgi:DNA-binding transcriptional LysR family regulator